MNHHSAWLLRAVHGPGTLTQAVAVKVWCNVEGRADKRWLGTRRGPWVVQYYLAFGPLRLKHFSLEMTCACDIHPSRSLSLSLSSARSR